MSKSDVPAKAAQGKRGRADLKKEPAMFWDWIFRITHWRQIRRDIREMNAICADNDRMLAEMDRRTREAFTPEEYETVRRRCEAQLGV